MAGLVGEIWIRARFHEPSNDGRVALRVEHCPRKRSVAPSVTRIEGCPRLQEHLDNLVAVLLAIFGVLLGRLVELVH